MTKADLVSNISKKTGIKSNDVRCTIDLFFEEVQESLKNGENVYLRGFGSFILKKKAEKLGRIIKKNISIRIPAHYVPSFKPSKVFIEDVKTNIPVE